MSDNALIAALIGALIACLVCLVPTLIRLNSLERRLRLRVGEGEKRAALRQKELVDSVNTVLQMSASVSQSAEERARQVSDRVEARLDAMTRANERQMADMRDLVDRQLGATLDRRLGQSFQQVTRQLEMVHQGLGEMQALAG